eukprot:scaffold291813_cov55-Attheya_sp.AAC.3
MGVAEILLELSRTERLHATGLRTGVARTRMGRMGNAYVTPAQNAPRPAAAKSRAAQRQKTGEDNSLISKMELSAV